MGKNIEVKEWADDILSKISQKMVCVTERNIGKIPYTTGADGRFDDKSGDKGISWWTNGFWGGELWELYRLSGNELFKKEAVKCEESLDRVFLDYNGMDHDSGFRWLPTSVINYKLNGDEKSVNRGLLAAANLAGRFNPNGNFIRAWNDWGDDRDTTGWAIIDCMMNLPLLYWASDVLKDPRFKAVAVAHADTAMKNFIRDDGSVRHIVGFDPVTGAFIREYGGQGYSEGSSWTRGQSWALYGFALSYKYTGENKYLHTSEKVADYVLSELPESYLVPIDYRQPKDVALEDSTAAAITASGLIELSWQLSDSDKALAEKYSDAAVNLLKALDKNSADYTTDKDNILERCAEAYHGNGHNMAIIYGDFYYIEALMKLSGNALPIFS